MTKPIVVGLDPLHEDQAPFHLATGLARATGAPLVTVGSYVHDPVSNAVSGGAIERDLKAYATAKLEKATDGSAELVVTGGSSPAQVLHDIAAERNAGMIVIGSTRKRPVGRLTPGSTAERLLHGAPCPVAVATGSLSADWRPQHIGVGFIDLEEGHEALRAAASLAAALSCSLTVVTAVEPIRPISSGIVWPYASGEDHEHARRAAERSLDAALQSLPASVNANGEVTLNHPVAALVELSRNVDMIVCGSRGYGPIRSVLLGAVTHWLVRQAHCPIVIVPRGTEQVLEQLVDRQEMTAT
jgi:nucleotide-binding universal stress UspA family protein